MKHFALNDCLQGAIVVGVRAGKCGYGLNVVAYMGWHSQALDHRQVAQRWIDQYVVPAKGVTVICRYEQNL